MADWRPGLRTRWALRRLVPPIFYDFLLLLLLAAYAQTASH